MADDKTFDPNPLFDYLPSIYRDFYANRPELHAVYEAWIRAQDSDYANLFQLDAAKDVSTVPVTTFYPLVYQELGNWESLQVPHAHWQASQDWPAADPLGDDDPEGTAIYRVRIPGRALKGRIQVMLDGRAVPSYVYTCSLEPWVENGELVQGTTLVFDATTDGDMPVGVFAKFLAGEYVGSASSNVSNDGTFGSGSGAPDEQPQQSSTDSYQGWAPADTYERVSFYVFRDQQIVQGTSDGTTTLYTPQIDGSAITYDEVDAQLTLESFDALPLLNIDYSVDTAPVITQKPLGGVGAGNLLQLQLSDSTLLFEALPPVGESLTISVPSGVTVTAAAVRIGFRLGAEFVAVSATEVALLGGNLFHGGSRVRIRDARGVQTVDVTAPTRKIQLPRTVDPDQVEILYLGTNILNPTITSTTLEFDRAPAKGVVFKLVAPIVEGHSHASYREVLEEDTDTVTLPATRPLALGPASELLEQFPVQVFLDDVDAQYDATLTEPTSYTFVDSRTIQFSEVLPAGVVVDVFYVDQETQDNHRHVFGEVTIPPTILEQFTVKLEAEFDKNKYPIQVFRDGFVFTDPEQFTVVSDQFVQFSDPLTPRITVSINAAIDSKAYMHSLPVRTDVDYGYRGQITNVALIRDGVSSWDIELSSASGDFELVIEDEETLLFADNRLDVGWFFETDVDERTIAQVWGEPIDLVRDSSAEYRGLTASLYAAYRGASTRAAIQNYGSILLGSAFLDQAGTAAGIVDTTTGQGLTVQPSDTSATSFIVPLLPGQPLRVLDAPNEMGKFYAVNDLVTVYDREELANVNLLALFAEQFSDDYRYAKRLDVREPVSFTSSAATFNTSNGLLTDFSVNFLEKEVWVGDLVKLSVVSLNAVTSAKETAFLPAGSGVFDVESLTYDATTSAIHPAGSVTVVTTTDALFAYPLDTSGTPDGAFTSFINAPADWQNALDEAFQVTGLSPSSPDGSGTTLVCSWPVTKAAPSSPTLFPVVGAVGFQEVLEKSYITLPTSVPSIQYARVLEVLDAHTLRVTFELDTDIIGYGEEGYGEFGYGGGTLTPTVSEYTVWSRRSRTLDQFLYLDEALDETQALAVGENVQLLNSQLADVLKHHAFAVKLRWGLAQSQAQLEDVAVFLNRIKPAETQAIVFTEAFEDEVTTNSALADSTTAALAESPPSLSVESSTPLANSLIAGETFAGQGSVDVQSEAKGWLYTPYKYTFGPEVASQVVAPPADASEGLFYLVADDQFLDQAQLFARAYSADRGLGNLTLAYEADEDRWVANSGLGYRPGSGLRLIGDRRLRVNNLGEQTFTLQANNRLAYASGSELAFRSWVKLDPAQLDPASSPVLFSYGPITVGFRFHDGGQAIQPYFDVGASELFVSPSPGTPTEYVYPSPLSPDDPQYDPDNPDPFGDDPAQTIPASITYTLPLNSWFEVAAQYRDTGSGFRTELIVNGELWAVGVPSPDASPDESTIADIVGEPLWIGGSEGGSPQYSLSGAIQQPAVSLTDAFSVQALLNSYAVPRPIHDIGVNATTGSPIVTDGLTLVYHFWRAWGLTIPDYSGNGFTAEKVAASVTSDWRVPGIVEDLWPRQLDVHTVDPAGTVLLQGAKVPVKAIDQSVTLDDDLDIDGVGAETPVLGTFVAGQVTYVAPNYWLQYTGLKGWRRLDGGTSSMAAAVDLDASDHFLGFTMPSDPAPDGMTYGPLASDSTVQGDRVTVIFEQEFGGAISELRWDGVNVLNALTKGRGAQFSYRGVGSTGDYTVNEGGQLLQPYTQPSGTPIIDAQFGLEAARTRGYAPYLVPFMYNGFTATTSGSIIDKHVEVDYLGNPSIIRMRSTFEAETTQREGSMRSQLGFALTDEFVNAYSYFPVEGGTGPVQVPFSLDSVFVFDNTQPGGYILTNADNSRAVGICSLGKVTPDSQMTALLIPPASQLTPVGQKYGQFNATLLLQEHLLDGVSTAPYTLERFVCIGSLTDVALAFAQLVLGEAPPIAIDPPPAALSVVQEPGFLVDPGQPFTVTVHVLTNEDTIDGDYEDFGIPIVASIFSSDGSGTLAGTTSKLTTNGIAVFDDLTISDDGNYQIQFTSASLAPDQAAVAIANPIPQLFFASPDTSFSDSPPSSITLFGANMDEDVKAFLIGATPTSEEVPVTFQSPGAITVTPDSALLDSPGFLSFRVRNDPPGGGLSGGVPFTVNSPADPGGGPTPQADLLVSDLTAIQPFPPTGVLGFQVTSQLFDSDFQGSQVLDNDANGTITLAIASPPVPGATFAGGSNTVQATTNGVAIQTVGFTRAGLYSLTAEWSGSPALSPAAATVPVETTALVYNPQPQLVELSPASGDQGDGDTLVRITGSTATPFYDGEHVVVANGTLPLQSSVVSLNQINCVVPAAAFANPTVWQLSVATNVGNPGLAVSAPLDFTVVGTEVPQGPFPNETDLPATISVTPTGWRRLLPTPDPAETLSSEPLVDALRQVGIYGDAEFPDGEGVYQPGPGTKGALDVVEIEAGAYSAIKFTDGTAAGEVQLVHTPTKGKPLIVRAKVNNLVTEPVVINRGPETSLYFDFPEVNQHIHFYGLKIRASEAAAIKTPGKLAKIRLKTGPDDNPVDLVQGTFKTKWEGLEFTDCDVLGEWDHALIKLAPNRWIRGIIGDDETGQDQYTDTGLVVADPDKLPWTRPQVERLAAFTDYPTIQIARNRPSTVVFGVSPPARTFSGFANKVEDPIFTVEAQPYSSSDQVFWSGYGDPDPTVYNQAASGTPLQKRARIRYITGAEGANPTVSWTNESGLAESLIISAGNVNVVADFLFGGGMARWNITGFNITGLYTFLIEIDADDIPSGTPFRQIVNIDVVENATSVTATEARVTARGTDPWVFSGTPGSQEFRTETFSQLIEFTDADGVLDVGDATPGTVSAELLPGLPTVGGNSWELESASTYDTDLSALVVQSGRVAPQLRLRVAGNGNISQVVQAFTAFYGGGSSGPGAGKAGIPFTVRFTPSNPAIDPVEVTYQLYYLGGSNNSFPAQSVEVPPANPNGEGIYTDLGIDQIADAYYPNVSHALVNNAAIGINDDGDAGFYLPHAGSVFPAEGGQPGGPFFPGWPGDPAHPNFDPLYSSLYPDPSNVPGLVYDGGVESLFGVTARNVHDFKWVNGNVVNIAQRHGIEVRNVGGNYTVIDKATIRLCGRSGVRVLSKLSGNALGGLLANMQAAPTGAATGGPSRGNVDIINCDIYDTGLSHAESAIDVSGHQVGTITIANNTLRLGYNNSLAHLRYMCGGGIDINDGPLYTYKDATAFYEHWPIYLTDKNGQLVLTYQDIVEGAMGFGQNDPAAPLTAELQQIITSHPALPGSSQHPLSSLSGTLEYPPVFDGTFATELSGPGPFDFNDIRGGGQQIQRALIQNNLIQINSIAPQDITSWTEAVPNRSAFFPTAVANPRTGQAVPGTGSGQPQRDLGYRYANTDLLGTGSGQVHCLYLGGCRFVEVSNNTFKGILNCAVVIDPSYGRAQEFSQNDPNRVFLYSSRNWQISAFNNTLSQVDEGVAALNQVVEYGFAGLPQDNQTSEDLATAFINSDNGVIGGEQLPLGLLLINMPTNYSGMFLVRATLPLPQGIPYSNDSALLLKHPVTGNVLATQWEPVAYYPNGVDMSVVELMAMVDPTGIPVDANNQATFEVVGTSV